MRRRLTLLLTCAVVAGALWWVLDAKVPVDAPLPDAAALPGEEDPAVLLAIPPSAPPGSAKQSATPAVARDEPPGMQAVHSAENRIAVRLQGLRTDDVDEVDGKVICGYVERQGTFDGIDTLWFAVPDQALPKSNEELLRLEVTAEGTLPLETALAWRELAHRRDEAGHRTWRTTVQLLTGVVQRGRVSDSQGDPVPLAHVEAYALHGTDIARKRYAHTTCDDLGGFALQLRSNTPTLLVAHTPAHAPGSVRVDRLSPETSAPPIDIPVSRGHTVRGRARWNGGLPDPAEDWTISCSVRSTNRFGSQGEWCLDTDRRVFRALGTVTLEKDGTFAFHGLSRMPHRIRVEDRDTETSADDATCEVAAVVVTPPALDVLLDLRPAWIQVEIRAEDEGLLEELGVGVSSEQSGMWSQVGEPWKRRAELRIDVGAELRYWVDVSAEGYAPAKQELISPEAGDQTTLRFVLKRPDAGAPVTLRFLASGIGPTHFRFDPVDGAGEMRSDIEQEWRSAVVPKDGLFRMTLPAGRWQLDCHPGRPRSGSIPRPWKQIRQVIEVPASGLTRDLAVEQGGVFRVTAGGSDGTPLPAVVRVFDAAGESISVSWVTPYNDSWWRNDRNQLESDGVGYSLDPLAPGRYRVVVELGGHTPWQRTVIVERGKTTRLNAVLVPTD